jgi:hypothetical protein
MGDLNIQTHWDRLLLPMRADFAAAEDGLTNAYLSDDGAAVKEASYQALRSGMAAAIFVYHFHEVVLDRKALHPQPANVTAIRALIEAATHDAVGDLRPDDHRVLGEAANAVKHAELRDPNTIHVAKTGRVLAITETGPDIYVEGKDKGYPQVAIITHAGERPLEAMARRSG